MNKPNLFLMIGLVGGAVLGLLASGSFSGFESGATAPKTNDSKHQMGADNHDHNRLQEVPINAVPSVKIVLDAEGGCTYNMRLDLTNFRFAPENVNGPHEAGEGHAHLYADGQKLSRIYSEWVHFAAPLGSKFIEVTLNSNDHATLANQGKPITATAAMDDC